MKLGEIHTGRSLDGRYEATLTYAGGSSLTCWADTKGGALAALSKEIEEARVHEHVVAWHAWFAAIQAYAEACRDGEGLVTQDAFDQWWGKR